MQKIKFNPELIGKPGITVKVDGEVPDFIKEYPNRNYPINAFTYMGTDMYGEPQEQIEPGLTKREYFAAIAMQGMLSKYGTDYQAQHAKESVYMADALIDELNKPKQDA